MPVRAIQLNSDCRGAHFALVRLFAALHAAAFGGALRTVQVPYFPGCLLSAAACTQRHFVSTEHPNAKVLYALYSSTPCTSRAGYGAPARAYAIHG